MTSCGTLLQGLLFGSFATVVDPADPKLLVENIPSQLILPLPAGTNHVLTATVVGGGTLSVWLRVAEGPRSSGGLPLREVGDNRFQINLADPAVLEVLRNHAAIGQFHIIADLDDGRRVQGIPIRYVVQARSGRIDFPWNDAAFTVYQRSSANLPAGNGSLAVRLGDITAGEVVVTVESPPGTTIVGSQLMRAGEQVLLPLSEVTYVLILERLVNRLLGEDYAEFRIIPNTGRQTHRIEPLLKDIETSGLVFVRNGQELPAEAFATHLRLKYEHASPRPRTRQEFITQIASRSSTTGEPYRVRLETGGTSDVRDWLEERLQGPTEPSNPPGAGVPPK